MLALKQTFSKQERQEASLSFGHKRARSSLSTLSASISCPHLPLFSTGASSPPAVTSAVAFGATTPTAEIFSSSASQKSTKNKEEDGLSSSADSKRLSMSGFPWEQRASSGNRSPAAELTGNIARRSRPVTPPAQLVHTKSDPTSAFDKRTSPKSNLRLELPPPRIDGTLGGHMDVNSDSFDTESCNSRHRFVGQPLLGLAFPTTPDIGVNNLPAMYGNCRDGERIQSSQADSSRVVVGRGGAVVGGGAAAAAQHVLLAAGSHMGRGGLALLTPPDDNGVLDWRHDNVRGIIADEPTIVRNIASKLEQHTPQDTTSENVEQVKVNPNGTGEGSDDAKRPEELLPNSSTSSTTTNSTPKPTKESTSAGDQKSPMGDDWIESAMDVLVGSTLPVSMSTEAVRILSYTLPCPLPDAPNSDDPNRANPINPDRLPASAASAPLVAAAAGQQLSPTIAAKCNLSDGRTSPDYDGGMTTALHLLTTAIQRRYLHEGSRRVYIHVSHAIDPQIPLSRLPSTPPLTGGGASAGAFGSPSFEGGDMGYFSPTVFNSIVVAPSSLTSTPVVGTPIQSHPPLALPSPNPILPPNSLHLTLLERYIPPTTITEDSAMFNVKHSIIIDRLFELSPNGGSLLFIYPTKTGAMNFDREYLGQVLDPLLRKLMVLYALREDLLWKIRNMSSTTHMAEYPELRNRIESFCNALSNGESDLPRTPTKLIYSSKVLIPLNEFSWREWWTTQEQMRIREIVKKHLSSQPSAPKSKPRTSKGKETETKSGYWQGYGVPGDLAREVLDGVRAPSVRPSSRGMGEAVLASSMSGSGGGGGTGIVGVGGASGEPRSYYSKQRKGVEVGVFVLRRGLDP